MTYFIVDPEEQLKEAERRLLNVRAVLANASETYENDPSRVNLIALRAAERLAKETLAQAEEWLP